MAGSELTLSVSGLNEYVNSILANDVRLRSIKVQGEISGFKRHLPSGHLYFTLKDDASSIRCVMFKSSTPSLRIVPRDGMKVVLSGKVSIFPRDGQYQFYVSSMKESGDGELYLEFLELKERLNAEGLFDRKRRIPPVPKCVGIVTSASGAAFHDISSVIARRFKRMHIMLTHASVQGREAPAEIIRGIELLNEIGTPDVIIVARGGGSYEDLSCFNDEGLARAIYASRIPIVSAVGHEIDYTIADFVADLRAPTPSAAAEICVPEYASLEAMIENGRKQMQLVVSNALASAKRRIDYCKSVPALANPLEMFALRRRNLAEMRIKMNYAVDSTMAAAYARIDASTQMLEAMSPKAVLKRGFAMISDESGRYLTNTHHLSNGQNLRITFADGNASVKVINIESEK